LPARPIGEAALTSGAATPIVGPARLLAEHAHRPWALPERPWLMAQTWEHLLFAHWRVPEDELRRVMPPGLPVDTFDGSAWLGVTPFRIGSQRLRFTPHVPPLSVFPEVNVRTYATVADKPGIYFLSLDTSSRLAVIAARRAYRLPYFRARMALDLRHEIDFRSARISADGPPADLHVRYRPTSAPRRARPGTLEHFLTERYCLYTLDADGGILRGEIHHPPWPIRDAEAEWPRNSMTAGHDLEVTDSAPLLHVASRQDVLIWPLRAAGAEE
jgi:uncharacterized protein YqjF (DUF2071 family)